MTSIFICHQCSGKCNDTTNYIADVFTGLEGIKDIFFVVAQVTVYMRIHSQI